MKQNAKTPFTSNNLELPQRKKLIKGSPMSEIIVNKSSSNAKVAERDDVLANQIELPMLQSVSSRKNKNIDQDHEVQVEDEVAEIKELSALENRSSKVEHIQGLRKISQPDGDLQNAEKKQMLVDKVLAADDQQSQQSSQQQRALYGLTDSHNFQDYKKTLEFDPSEHTFIIPPPEALMPKSLFQFEEAKSGAGINFLKLQKLQGKELIEKMNPDKASNSRQRRDRGDCDISDCITISEYIIESFHKKKLIYCRYGEKYVHDLEKRKKSSLAESNLPSQNLASASYLLNIKRLIEEHNIDANQKDFKKMKMDKMKVNDSGS